MLLCSQRILHGKTFFSPPLAFIISSSTHKDCNESECDENRQHNFIITRLVKWLRLIFNIFGCGATRCGMFCSSWMGNCSFDIEKHVKHFNWQNFNLTCQLFLDKSKNEFIASFPFPAVDRAHRRMVLIAERFCYKVWSWNNWRDERQVRLFKVKNTHEWMVSSLENQITC